MLTILFNTVLVLWFGVINWLVIIAAEHRVRFGKQPVTFSNFIEQDYEWFIYGTATLTNLWSIYYVCN